MIDKSGCLKWEEYDQIGVIRLLGSPSNTIATPDFAEITTVKKWVEQDSIRGIIITGEGRHFSKGADIDYFYRRELDTNELISQFIKGRDILTYIENIGKPVIAAIDGICFGAGLEIALSCHMRICSKDALFSFPEVNYGIMPGLGGVERLTQLIGKARAFELLITGDTFDAQYAREIGVVNRVVDNGSCDYAFKFMERIIKKGAKPVSYAIKAVNNSCTLTLEEAIREEGQMFVELVMEEYGLRGE